jgi:uncharacterized protein (DUF58 family)
MKLLPVWLSLELPWIPRLAPARAYSDAPVEEGGEGEKEENEEFNRQSLLHSSLRLLSREKSRRVLSLKALKRGISRPGPVLVCAGDLLGLSSRTRSFTSGCEIIIFPRRLRLKTLNLPFQEYFGAHAARGPVEDPAWYAGTRDYTGTRPAKNIHWKASARLGSLQEKLYEPTLQRKLLFILDAADWEFCAGEETGERAGEETGEKTEGRAGENAGGSAGNFERMMETLGTLAGALMETGASFGLVTNARLEDPRAGVLPAGRGPEHLGRLLEILARVTGTSRTGLEKAIRGAARGYAGFVYCGASAGKRASRVLREISGGKKILCVFGISAIQDTPLWEGFPSCRMEDLCGDPE